MWPLCTLSAAVCSVRSEVLIHVDGTGSPVHTSQLGNMMTLLKYSAHTVLGTCWPRTNLIQRMCFFKTVRPINHRLFLERNAHHRSTYAGLYKTHNSSWNDGTHILFPINFITRTHAAQAERLILGHWVMSEFFSSLHPFIYFWVTPAEHYDQSCHVPSRTQILLLRNAEASSFSSAVKTSGLLQSNKEADTF